MADLAGNWLTAAACSTAPRPQPAATFGELPQQHQDEVVRLGFAAAAAVAYFVTLAVLARPIPSRSLAAHTMLPNGLPQRSALLATRTVPARVAPSPLTPVISDVRPAVQLPAAREQVANAAAPVDSATRDDRPTPAVRRNPVSRFFRGIWRGVQAPARKAADSL